MAGDYINMFECDDKDGRKPHYKGYITLGGVDYQFALWPKDNGKGYSGTVKPKQENPTMGRGSRLLD